MAILVKITADMIFVCITVDFESLDNQTVTVRDRDSMKQDRGSLDAL